VSSLPPSSPGGSMHTMVLVEGVVRGNMASTEEGRVLMNPGPSDKSTISLDTSWN